MDIPQIFNITESAHRIHNPITPEKLATVGGALRLESGARVLELGSGSGEMLCTWARDHGVIGAVIDMSQLFTEQAKLRAVELGVADQVKFMHGDAAGYVSDEKISVAACLGATWITGGVVGTIKLRARGLHTGGIILIGEPYWRQLPPTEEVARGVLPTQSRTFSCFQDFSRLLATLATTWLKSSWLTVSSRSTVDRKYARGQKCCPTKFLFLSPHTRAKWIALFPLCTRSPRIPRTWAISQSSCARGPTSSASPRSGIPSA